jgi:hypothetical protein
MGHAKGEGMEIIPNETPTPRLLVTAVADRWSSVAAGPHATGKLQRGAWTGNAFAIFAGCSIGLLLLCGASTFVITHHTPAPEEIGSPRLIPVTPPKAAVKLIPAAVSLASEGPAKSTPVTVQITPEHFRVTAISLGHPRLAVINRQQVAEGDWIEVATTAGRVGVKLQIIKIADGNIELTVGEHVITVPLERLKLSRSD